jgi:hypothetical protein
LLSFDPARGFWQQRSLLPVTWDSHHEESHLTVVAAGGTLYAIGSDFETNPVALQYDAASDRWSPVPPPQVGRHRPGLAEVDGRIYVIGGYTGLAAGFLNGTPSGVVEEGRLW